ncbi:LRR domain containing protein [Parasponia andersonii]|uniref:LRR domain containing protein n=1 Tax=Parasponia andersonii TaxID=3476 RepID=A0A2P5B056_PARAD|nr:LRR domain containing protein [Parasponia andersonii]
MLKVLCVRECGKLKSLTPSYLTFQNLKDVLKSNCYEMVNSLAFSTSKRVIQLKRMSITQCKRMIEIVFDRLKILVLHDLPNFHSEIAVISFPCLEKLIISRCPEMQSFSLGTISTPKLSGVIAKVDDESIWRRSELLGLYFNSLTCEGDVNTTVRKLWEVDSISDTTLQEFFVEKV